MNTKFLLLWLEAPLQAWGADSKFGRRNTMPFPTRSGVLGLILCALGASGEQKELLERMANFRQTVISFVRTCKDSERKPVPLEKEPFLRDFHMVGSGYDETNPRESLMIPKTCEGKKAVGGGTKVTYRYYLQDTRFAVIFEAPSDLASSFSQALQNPVFDLYLGRKNCVPSEFIYQGTFEDEEKAFERVFTIVSEKKLLEDFRVIDGEQEGEIMTINDVPVQFGPIKKYRDRRITLVQS